MGDKNETWTPNYDNCDKVSDRCPVEYTIYQDYLSEPASGFFAIAFALLFLAQILQGFRAKTWSYMIWLGIGTVFEVAGHVGRFGLGRNPWQQNVFIVQYLTLLLAPTLVAAAISVTFKHLVVWYGARWSLLKPRLYPLVFVGTDFISIFIQIIGGGLTAMQSMGKGSETTQKLGEALVIGGVAFQVANMLCCGGLMLLYARRRKQAMKQRDPLMGNATDMYTTGMPTRGRVPVAREEATLKEAKRVKWFVYALGIAYTCIIIRCAYRIAETVPDIGVDVLRNETLFIVFDATMMLISIGAVTILHPCFFFPYLGLRKKQKNQSKVYEGYRMESSSALTSLELVTPNGNVSDDAVQLQNLDQRFESRASDAQFSLPPVDGGRKAYLFLAACWVVEAVTFGFGFSFGVFQEYYSHHEPFAGSNSIAAIGTTTTGMLYLGAPFVVIICRFYPRQARWFTYAGLFVTSLAMVMSSFCTTVPQLIATQGVLFGIGGCFAYCPCTLYIDEWFVRRKGFAYGIVWSAAGAGGAVLPLILETLLKNYGFQTTVRICAGILFATAAPIAYFIKPRLPLSATIHRKPLNMRFVTSRVFLLHQLVNVVEATGYFLPTIYLPTYARTTFGTSTILSALTVILVNIATTIGLMVMGSLSDKLAVTTCMLISAVGVGISVLLVWGLTASLPVLYVFCVMYGLFAGSWASIWPGIMREVTQKFQDENEHIDPVMVHGHLCVGRGVGNIISGPLSGSLIRGQPWQGRVIGGYGSGYGILILYTGLTGLVSGMNFLWRYVNVL
ncbi:RTA-like protein [Fusarium oxysporum f. sp. vasinfectum]|nr:RTA-like protein [Fusarium oxysporum f. sp. vasinfectum]KAK2933014.1 RTA-like protein [Fusarium oxysporum f. sp. vasinfectum]